LKLSSLWAKAGRAARIGNGDLVNLAGGDLSMVKSRNAGWAERTDRRLGASSNDNRASVHPHVGGSLASTLAMALKMHCAKGNAGFIRVQQLFDSRLSRPKRLLVSAIE